MSTTPVLAHLPQCPQCETPLDNTNDEVVSCVYCGAQLRLTRDLYDIQVELLKPGAAYLLEIRSLLKQGRRLEAIKTYQLSTSMGVEDATRVIDALEKGTPPPKLEKVLQSTTVKVPGPPVWLRALKMVATIAVVVIAIGFIVQVAIRLSGAFDPAIEMLNTNPIALEAFGKPISPGGIIIGIMLPSGDNWRADYRVPIHGTQRDGTLYVTGSSTSKDWKLTSVAEYTENGKTVTIRMPK